MISRSAIQISGLFSLGLLLACNPGAKENQIYRLDSPVENDASLPYLVSGDDGNLYLSWVEQKADTSILKYAVLEGDTFASTKTIASGTNWFVNWADYPMIAINKKGDILAHYLAKSSKGTYSYDVNMVIKPADQSTWSQPIVPHSDNTPTEHGFVTMLPQPDNTFTIAWLDGRNTGEMNHDSHESTGDGAMTLRTAIVATDGKISKEVELDDRVCDCCQTTGVIADSGPLFFYRDRSENEIRDIAYVGTQGNEWVESQMVHNDNWKINGCPVNGPRAGAYQNTVAVAWFSAPRNQGAVKIAFSVDGGKNFNAPILIDSLSPLGRVDLVMVNENDAVVSWLTKEGDDVVIKAQSISVDGEEREAITIEKTSEARGSGFPQMALNGDQLYFAWTDFQENEKTTVLLKRLSLEY